MLGIRAYLRTESSDPTKSKSLTYIGFCELSCPTTIFSNLLLKSSKFFESAIIAIISDAVTISKLVSLKGALFFPPIPITIFLNPLSSTSVTLFQVIPEGSMLSI